MFSIKLKELRNNYGISQKKLSEELFVSQQTVAKWEMDKATPNPEMLAKISDFFNVSADYLLGRDGYNKKINPPSKEDELISTFNLDDEDLQKLTELLHMIDSMSDENFNKIMDYANLVLADQLRNEAE